MRLFHLFHLPFLYFLINSHLLLFHCPQFYLMYSYSDPLQIQTYFFDVFSLIYSIKMFIIAGYLFSSITS